MCLKDGVELQSSHFLPAAVYRAMRSKSSQGNPNPWEVTPISAKQTSRQVKAPLLCRDCEQRFSSNGERWVFTHGLRNDGTFPLAAILASRVPEAYDPSISSTKIYSAAQIPEINQAALTYFAVSMFWRGSIHPWKRDGTCPVPLGPYEEPVRQFLLGTAGFPVDVTLNVVVREPSGIRYLTHEPLGEWRGDLFVSKFPMPGLAFALNAGKALPAPLRNTCFVRGPGNPIVLSGTLEQPILDESVRMIKSGSRKP